MGILQLLFQIWIIAGRQEEQDHQKKVSVPPSSFRCFFNNKIMGRLLTATQVAVYEIWDMVVVDDDAYYFIIASAPEEGEKRP